RSSAVVKLPISPVSPLDILPSRYAIADLHTLPDCQAHTGMIASCTTGSIITHYSSPSLRTIESAPTYDVCKIGLRCANSRLSRSPHHAPRRIPLHELIHREAKHRFANLDVTVHRLRHVASRLYGDEEPIGSRRELPAVRQEPFLLPIANEAPDATMVAFDRVG